LGRNFLGHLNINLANNFNVKYVFGKDSPLFAKSKKSIANIDLHMSSIEIM
jgi:hypothetical protein